MKPEIRLLDNESLLNKTKELAVEERKLTLEILHHLQEISRRRLFAFRGFGSLFEYATKELGYSSAAAMRRISAMRLLSEIPDVEDKIETGALSLSVAAQAQNLFKTEEKLNKPFELQKKKAILENLANKSSREAAIELIQHSSQPVSLQKPDQVRPITVTHSEIRFIAEQSLLEELEQIKRLLANKNPNFSLGELISEMAKITLDKLRPKAPKSSSGSTVQKFTPKNGPIHFDVEQKKSKDISKPLGVGQASAKFLSSRYASAEVKRIVYQRDLGKCQFVDPLTGRKCNSSRAIHYDHVIPFALGGPTTVENLSLLCATHNRVVALKVYGQKMSDYLKAT